MDWLTARAATRRRRATWDPVCTCCCSHSTRCSSDVQSTNGIVGADISNLVSSQEYNVIRLAFALTVPGMFVLCLGVNFLCYKIGFKKGKNDNQKSKFKDTQGVHYHHYDNENDPLRGAGEGPGPSRGQIIIDPAAHDYAAYDEIKEQRQRMLGSQRGKDGGYITPMSQDRPLPPVGGDGNGYMSPTAAAKDSSKSKDSPSPPGNGGYLSPLEEQLAKHSSSNSDSSSNKSDKSRKYQNDPRAKPKTQGLYESIKDAGVTQEHQYIELQRNVVS